MDSEDAKGNFNIRATGQGWCPLIFFYVLFTLDFNLTATAIIGDFKSQISSIKRFTQFP